MDAKEAIVKLPRIANEHDLFQRALWVMLDGKEVVIAPGEGGTVEYVKLDENRTLVRRARELPSKP